MLRVRVNVVNVSAVRCETVVSRWRNTIYRHSRLLLNVKC